MYKRQLLYCLLLPSAADAANTLAEGVSGDIASFVELMNQKAESLSLKNTHFVNTYGRDDDMQYTTASAKMCIRDSPTAA